MPQFKLIDWTSENINDPVILKLLWSVGPIRVLLINEEFLNVSIFGKVDILKEIKMLQSNKAT